jgi:hypothetical protein
MERLRGVGLVGLVLLGMVVLLPLSVASFYVTAQLTLLALGLAVVGAMVLWVVLLPASVYEGVSRRPNPRTYALVTAAWVGLIVLGLALFRLDQQAKSERVEARIEADIAAGVSLRCDHPDSSADGPVVFPADMRASLQAYGWTCE